MPPICRFHGGAAPQVLRRAAVRAELQSWGLDAPTVDPGETMLKLVSQSSVRVDRYARLLRDAFEAAEQLRQAHEGGELALVEDETEDGEPGALQVARSNWERVFATGGVAALIGNTYSSGDFGVYATGEAIRGLADLEMRERKLCADFASKAIAAGLNERLVRVAEQQGAMILAMMRAVLGDQRLGLTEAQLAAAPMIIESHVAELLGE